MTSTVLLLVLAAALLHAVWNALVKASTDRTVILGLLSIGHIILGIGLAFNFPAPSPASWPFIAASTIVHFGYYYLLNRSYQLGDLSQTYPIARGISPVLITLGALIFVGETVSIQAWVGILIVTLGIFLLSIRSSTQRIPIGLLMTALATGLTIATYSLIDGVGARSSGAALGYIGWLFIFEIFVVLFVLAHARSRLKSVPRTLILTGIAGGIISATAYGLVIVAKTLAPLGVVSTLRETSVLFAALIGVVLLKERPWRGRLLSACVVVIGVVILATA